MMILAGLLCLSLPSARAESASETSELPVRLLPEAALSLPQPLLVGVQLARAVDDRVRPFAEAGWFRLGFGDPKKNLTQTTLAVGIRWFPDSTRSREQGWFVSAAFGWHQISFAADLSAFKVTDEPIASRGIIHVQAFYLAPGIGYRFQLSEKFQASTELALRMPIIPYGRMLFEDDATGTDSDNNSSLATSSNTGITRIAALVLPELTLFRISYAF